MAQPGGHFAQANPASKLVFPDIGPAGGPYRHPVRQGRCFARKSYGGPIGLTARQQRRTRDASRSCDAWPPNLQWKFVGTMAISSKYSHIRREKSLTEKVLSNHLIWNIVGSHLSISDLKICRLVCRLFNYHILNSTKFRDRALVTITPNLLCREEFGTTQISWKHISLPVQQVCEKAECSQVHLHDDSWVIPMLSEVESLILVKGPPCPVITVAISPCPTLMFKASKKLRDLTMDEQILCFCEFTKFSAQLSRLQAFKIATKTYMSLDTPLIPVEKMLNVTKNLRVFKSSFKMDPDAGRSFLKSTVENITLLIQQNLPRMEILKPRDPLFWTDELLERQSIIHMKFPLLTSVRICVTSQNGFDVIEFIKAQPKLTELTLDSFDTGVTVFPNLVLGAVAEISGRLKKLHVKAREFRDLTAHDWQFLKRSNIQDLSIWPCKDRLYAGEAIQGTEFVPVLFCYLPPKVKRVKLQSRFGLNSNVRNYPVMRIYLGHRSFDPQVLTCLCLSGMAGFITDANLKYIFSVFFKLKELHLSDLDDRVTDYGFTGVSSWSPVSDFSIQNLKGLHTLTVRSCKNISNFSLVKAFKFQELRHLDLSCNPNINVQGCIAVAQQNPSLEVFMNDHLSEFPPGDSIRREHFPRLKCLQKWLPGREIINYYR